jgi:NAD-dependent dihydropyrimidine dehydrogenase PreA subunit
MKELRYLSNVVTLQLDPERCTGCGQCLAVCPHGVFARNGKVVRIQDRDGCMECGACARNCPVEAIRVNPGVGCAAYIIQSWIRGKEKASCGPDCC